MFLMLSPCNNLPFIPSFNHPRFSSSPLPSSLFPLPSSLSPLPSSLFPLSVFPSSSHLLPPPHCRAFVLTEMPCENTQRERACSRSLYKTPTMPKLPVRLRLCDWVIVGRGPSSPSIFGPPLCVNSSSFISLHWSFPPPKPSLLLLRLCLGPSAVKIALDLRSHAREVDNLLFPKTAEFQGPALLCFNDSTFTETDLHR